MVQAFVEATGALYMWNSSAIWEVEAAVGATTSLPGLDISIYEGQLPIKWEGSAQNAQSFRAARCIATCSCLMAGGAVGVMV